MASILGKLLGRKTHSTIAAESFDSIVERATRAAETQDFQRALELCDQALSLDPASAEVHYKRGNALRNLGRFDEAVASYDKAIERRAEFAHAFCNRGAAQQALGLTAQSLSSYERAIALDPADAMAHYNRALLMQECSRWDEALKSYDRAISIDPQFADAQCNRAMALLFCADFERGWSGYEWRWKVAQRLGIGETRHFVQPLWLGEEPIAGKRLLLHCEGGLGDTLQFCRYAPMAKARGAIVYMEVQSPLVGLLARLDGVSQVLAKGNTLPNFDYHCPMMSLPLAFKTALSTVPAATGYLHADAAKVDVWRSTLARWEGPRVGLTWSGNPAHANDRRRSIGLAHMAKYLPAGAHYFCLQKDLREGDRATLDSTPFITYFDNGAMDFDSTAALCECMDAVISVDSSIAHLCGALGRPTWILLPFTPDFRWMREGDDTPWYSSAKLYRQAAADDWDQVLARIRADLRRELRLG